jgi:predicted alpha/beta-fold hydrolase
MPRPPRGLAGPHTQTLLSSTACKALVRRRTAGFHSQSRRELVTAADGARLEVWLHEGSAHVSSGVVVIHGWLGSATSGYTLAAAAALSQAGFATARLNLRDHGDTACLNEDLFHSARIDEVVDVVRLLANRWNATGVLGFSLGGNFALRVARATGLPTLAVCPALDPALTLACIDGGMPIYRRYFVTKWHRALAAKQAAFPDRYDFGPARRLANVSNLTDWFVANHSEFASTADYFSRYNLTGDALEDTRATILAARDDPVIPPIQFDRLPPSIEVRLTAYGGHCAFLRNWRLENAVDGWASRFFTRELVTEPGSGQTVLTGSGKSRYNAN